MGSDTVADPYSIPKLPLFSIPPPHLPEEEPSGMSTPPLQTTVASVPFRWEEQPGKPRPCTDIITTSNRPTKCLDLPPRLATVDPPTTTKTASPSPTTVLDGPGDVGPKSFFSSSSFRFVKERRRRERRQSSFDSNGSGDGGWSPNGDGEKVDRRLLLGEKVDRRDGGRGLFGSFRFKGKVTSSVDLKGRKMRRNASVSKVSGSHFWVKIYEGFKQVVPWRKKPKIECFTL